MTKKTIRKGFQDRIKAMIHSLRDGIVSGQLSVGTYLPSEDDLEKRFQLGNNSVRRGLEALVEEGLIEKIPRVGNKVKMLPEQMKLTVRFGYCSELTESTIIDSIVERFHSQYPQIAIQLVALPLYGYGGALMQYMEAGMLDVVMMSNTNYQDFVEAECTELFEPLDAADVCHPFLTKPFTVNGRLLVQPFIYSPVILCYNKAHFREKLLPEPDGSWTWDDLFEAGKRLAVQERRFGFYFYLPSRNRWPVFMLQSGAAVKPDGSGRYRLRESAVLEGLELCRKMLADADVFPRMLSESDADAEALFKEEKVSVIMTTYYFLNELKRSSLLFEVAPLPRLNNSKTPLVITGLAVNSRSAHKEAAKRLLQFLASYEIQLMLRKSTYYLPAHRLVAETQEEELDYRPARFMMYREIASTYSMINEIGLSNRQLKLIQREVMLFLSNVYDQERFCRRLEQLLNEPVTQAGNAT
ncbi:extracellular solute-binding protein [Paenibacillus thalictri]|nr:extracellular solute-binding protein [Paenibacillus thalictri]